MSKMYRTCPRCGAHLDHGEHCDCVSHKPRTNAASAGKTRESWQQQNVALPLSCPAHRKTI